MPLHVALTHRTAYRYARPVLLGPQTIRLRPAPQCRTPIVSYALKVEPQPHVLNWQQDPQGNHLARVVFPDRVGHFHVTVDLVADMATINPFDFFLEPQAELWPFGYDPVLDAELSPFRRLTPPGPLLNALLARVPRDTMPMVDKLVALNTEVFNHVAYVVRLEPGVWTPERTLAEGRGSCRDSAWLLVQLLRHLGFAARFVSGYLIQLRPDVTPLTGPEGPASDATDLHAWAEVYLPGAGWIGLDPTSGLLTGEGHIPLAASPDPASAAAISGAVETVETGFDVAMAVTRIRETPRTTKPYAEAEWQAILARGERVDAALAAGDVRLTMGSKPSFVAADGMDAAGWNTAAEGPARLGHATRLLRALAGRWAPGAMLRHGLGKPRPGEPLPRRALSAHWRRDGEAVWRDPALLAMSGEDPGGNQGEATAADAIRFAQALAGRLGLDPALAVPAHEDAGYYLWREGRLPADVTVEDARLGDALEGARLARVFAQGLAAPVGAVLPLRGEAAPHGSRRWRSARWRFRGGTLRLVPGDGPIGLRLPLGSLPWADPAALDAEAAPLAPPPPLPPPLADAPPHEALVRTALTVEARDGLLHVFVPPLAAAEDWLGLIAAIEATAAELGRTVALEGHAPPRDDRLLSFSVTPGPGVIEVGVHPAATWAEQVGRTETLYAEANALGLAAERFLMDGRHVGTGGGGPVVLGGATPADSPFLRRPDLLTSLLGFWHNHPSLSYLFSGLSIGPAGRHPRLDEMRHDGLAELEIAFPQVRPPPSDGRRAAGPDRPDQPAGDRMPPWMVDRLFRAILADATGDTHHAEFGIDRLHPPGSSAGRLGLVEYRAPEMPPDARMALAAALLLRGAVAAFWRTPYDRPLVRWGTRLHDEFLLPHYAALDFEGALAELATLGVPLDPAWFAPQQEFRFPFIGEVTVLGTTLELRHALEPWHVPGEEPGAEPAGGGAVRHVGASTERVQARVSGWVPERFVLGCNGHAVPLSPAGRPGEYVGGIRFEAWGPPFAPHPRLRAQAPLTFDIHDRWTGRSLGGATYHAAHPGGRDDRTPPVNAKEAEARRRSRFQPFGHTPGPMPEPRPLPSPEAARSLDLRRAG